MQFFRLSVRALALLSYAIWVGGFTFYGAVVLWSVHEAFGSLDSGKITQAITVPLNWIGVATLAVWALLAWLERAKQPKWAWWSLVAMIAVSSLLQVGLFIDHGILDRRLAEFGLEGFYAYHSVYLNISTFQWGVNLLMIPLVVWLWREA
jgi:NAD/NADP transhydrogenase beta subunit